MKAKHGKARILVVIIALIVSVAAILISRSNIEKETKLQLVANLEDVARQNEATIENLLGQAHGMLFEIGEAMENKQFDFTTEEGIWEIVDWLKNYDYISNFKRMGIITTTGMAYTTDGYCEQLEDQPYQYGIQGIDHISSTLVDAIGTAESINVFSIPLFEQDDHTVKAILFATYRTKNFKELLNINSYSGSGYSYIIRTDGAVIVDSEKSPIYGSKNLLDTLRMYGGDNIAVAERLHSNMWKGKSGYEQVFIRDSRSFYYTPIQVNANNQNWYLLTVVPTEVLDKKVATLLLYQDILVLTGAVTITILVLYFVHTYRKDDRLLRQMAYIDPLTGGDNMYAFREQMKMRRLNWGYVVAMDLNDFKLVNSLCGITKGDETIRRMWQVIASNIGPRENAAHVGGDHFVIYLQEVYKDKLEARLQKLREEIEAIAEELEIISIMPYFGIYEIKNSRDPEENYNCANQAKRLIKGNKRKSWAFYEDIDFQKIIDDRKLVDSFKGAIENNEFEIWYQPKFNGRNSQMVGAEALVRWRKPDGSLIPPNRFIPLFESNGMIITLDQYIFGKVCEQQKAWEKEGKHILPVSVNISRVSLYYGKIVGKYQDIVRVHKLDPGMVPIEITESATMKNAQVKELVEKFRQVGFKLCLDDFGDGYSSLSMLNTIRFDVLKLDKSLIDFVGDEEGEKLIRSTVELAKSMGMKITAEGVENVAQVEFLNKLECDEIQGYYFSKPLPLEEFTALLLTQ